MNIYAVYEADGTLVKAISCSEDEIEMNIDQGQLFMTTDVFANYDTQYVSNNTIVDKTEFPELTVSPATIGSLISITNIPTGSKVRWPDGVVTPEDDGELSFTVDVGGEYFFEFRHPLYLSKRLTIDVS
jgi:hypothetical protein